jgi:hypothetical protein
MFFLKKRENMSKCGTYLHTPINTYNTNAKITKRRKRKML